MSLAYIDTISIPSQKLLKNCCAQSKSLAVIFLSVCIGYVIITHSYHYDILTEYTLQMDSGSGRHGKTCKGRTTKPMEHSDGKVCIQVGKADVSKHVESSVFLPGQTRSRAVHVPTILDMFCSVSTGTRDWTSFTSLDKEHRKNTVGEKLVKWYTVYRAAAWFQFTSCPYRYIRYAASLAVE